MTADPFASSAAGQPTESGQSPQVLVASVLVMAATLPMFGLHLVRLWNQHAPYSAFPLLLAAATFLFWWRWPRSHPVFTKWSRRIEAVMFVTAVICLCAASFLRSPPLGAVGTILTLSGVCLRLTAGLAFTHLLGPWLMLWLLIPPPWQFDSRSLGRWQNLTAGCSSQLLEMANVRHLRLGHVFHLGDQEFLEAQTSSGLFSPLMLVFCAAIYAVVARRTLLHGGVVMVSTLLWAVLIDIVRVTTVIVAWARYDIDLRSGWMHLALGLVLLAVGFFLVVCTDKVLDILLAPIHVSALEMQQQPTTNLRTREPLSILWNEFIAPRSHDSSKSAASKCDGNQEPRSTATIWGWAGAFCCLGLLQGVMIYQGRIADDDRTTGSLPVQVLQDLFSKRGQPEMLD